MTQVGFAGLSHLGLEASLGVASKGREVLAFDLYGTLVDPIAISDELGRVLGHAHRCGDGQPTT